VESDRIVILDRVYFAPNSDVILAKSFSILRQVGLTLKANTEIRRIRVVGHTDNAGTDAFNQDLSERRARSVRAFLVENGIDLGRMETVGYGESTHIDTNETPVGRANNRRVEFLILEAAPPM